MEIPSRVYDDNSDIFYNNKYLDVLKEKDYVLPVKKVKYEINIKFEKVKKDEKENVTIDDKIRYIENTKIKNYYVKHFRQKLSINRYLKMDKSTIYDNKTTAINYVIKKYAKLDYNNKKILFIDSIIAYVNVTKYISHKNTLMPSLAYNIFRNSSNCDIYSILSHDVTDKYAPQIRNGNGNTYNFVNHNNNGNLLKYFNSIFDKIKSIKFDIIICELGINLKYQNSINFKKNNFYLLILHMINKISKQNSIFLYIPLMIDTMNYSNLAIGNSYDETLIIKPKYFGLMYSQSFILYKKFKNKPNNFFVQLTNIVKKIISDKYNVHEYCVVKSNVTNVKNFLENIKKKRYRRFIILSKIIKYLVDDKYSALKKIIMRTIKVKQLAHANNNKNKKYIII